MNDLERMIAKGRQLGLEEGCQEARQITRQLVLTQLGSRFGASPAEVEVRVRKAEVPTLERWASRILGAATMDDVFADPHTH